jgi:mRNA-degrading endonuclease RelE of RelBE toxin-antitoxin system
MNFKTTDLFDKQAKKLSKKYRNIKSDLSSFLKDFEKLHTSATTIQNNLYKIRIVNSNKNKGKSAGYRVYYYIQLETTTYLLTIYDKSEVEMIDEELLKDLIEEL